MTTRSWKEYTVLHKKPQRREHGLFLIEGLRLCEEALASTLVIREAFISADFMNGSQWLEFRQALQRRDLEYRLLEERNLRKLADTEQPQGVVLVAETPPAADLLPADGRPILLLDGVRDPGNAGTLIRTADWFGCGAVILHDSVDPWSGKVLRSSMGSAFRLPLPELTPSAVTAPLRAAGYQVIAAVPDAGESLSEAHFGRPVLLVLGNEAHGISRETAAQTDRHLAIPRYGNAESLNVAVAGGIFLQAIATQIANKAGNGSKQR